MATAARERRTRLIPVQRGFNLAIHIVLQLFRSNSEVSTQQSNIGTHESNTSTKQPRRVTHRPPVCTRCREVSRSLVRFAGVDQRRNRRSTRVLRCCYVLRTVCSTGIGTVVEEPLFCARLHDHTAVRCVCYSITCKLRQRLHSARRLASLGPVVVSQPHRECARKHARRRVMMMMVAPPHVPIFILVRSSAVGFIIVGRKADIPGLPHSGFPRCIRRSFLLVRSFRAVENSAPPLDLPLYGFCFEHCSYGRSPNVVTENSPMIHGPCSYRFKNEQTLR